MKNSYGFILALFLFILFAGNPVLASPYWEWGAKAGFVKSKARFSSDLPYITLNSLDSFSAGCYVSLFFLGETLGIQPEINYSVKGFDVIEEDLGQKISSKYKISYFEIPLLLALRVPLKGRIEPGLVFGPYVGFARKAMEVQTAFGTTEKRELDDNLKKMDFGLVFGGNVRYRLGAVNILLSVRYSLGLVTISRDIMDVSYDFGEKDTIKNRALTVSIGVGYVPSATR